MNATKKNIWLYFHTNVIPTLLIEMEHNALFLHSIYTFENYSVTSYISTKRTENPLSCPIIPWCAPKDTNVSPHLLSMNPHDVILSAPPSIVTYLCTWQLSNITRIQQIHPGHGELWPRVLQEGTEERNCWLPCWNHSLLEEALLSVSENLSDIWRNTISIHLLWPVTPHLIPTKTQTQVQSKGQTPLC